MYSNEFLRTSVDVMLQSDFFFTLIGTELIHMKFPLFKEEALELSFCS
jgi:hypothetical protein